MPRPTINLHDKVRGLLQHTAPPSPEARWPLRHFEDSANVGLALANYVDDHIDAESVYLGVYDRHMRHLRRMILADLLEAFERFLKELAAACVDQLAPWSIDDRFEAFALKRPEQLAAFVHAGSIGKALCESDTWLNNQAIGERFRSLLRSPFGDKWEWLFPEASQQPAAERPRAATLAVLWQVRHNLAHNVGVLTHSDAMKLRLMVKGPVAADRQLAPDLLDLRHVKRFLWETAEHTNGRVGKRLAAVLTEMHAADPLLFPAQAKADELTRQFGFALTVGGAVGVP